MSLQSTFITGNLGVRNFLPFHLINRFLFHSNVVCSRSPHFSEISASLLCALSNGQGLLKSQITFSQQFLLNARIIDSARQTIMKHLLQRVSKVAMFCKMSQVSDKFGNCLILLPNSYVETILCIFRLAQCIINRSHSIIMFWQALTDQWTHGDSLNSRKTGWTGIWGNTRLTSLKLDNTKKNEMEVAPITISSLHKFWGCTVTLERNILRLKV